MSVETLHEQYTEFQQDWTKTRDCLLGDTAVKSKGVEYVQPFASMFDGAVLNQKVYNAFLSQAVFTQHALKISTNANGLLYAKQPVIEVPSQMEVILEDATLTGQSFMDVVKEGTSEIFNVSRVCYLVDVAKDDRDEETKQSTTFNGRPFLRLYKTESVINWRYDRIDGVEVLALVVLQESEDVWLDEFTNEPETIYRVLRLTNGVYTQQVYKKDHSKKDSDYEGGEIITPLNAGKSLDSIPFVGINQLSGTLNIIKSPLMPIVNLNLYHFMRSVDKGQQLHEMAAGTVVIFGVEDFNGDFKTGGSYVFPTPMGGGTSSAQILERSGDGMPSQEREIELTENAMYKLGSGIIQDEKNGIESFNTQNARTVGERAVVVSIADTASQQFTKILKIIAEWMGADANGIKFELNTDFIDNNLSVDEIVKLGEVNVISPILTEREIFDILVSGKAISENTDYETHKTELEEQTPQLSVSPLKPKAKESDISTLANIAQYIGLGNKREA
ncbi:MAG: DUF4055 domain-containing protein [Campylobacterota bacterium]|nr:DUF4055 domain-containing protein [Campylobacterota bacterium]